MTTAIICGSGPDVWDDLARARFIAPDAHIVGVNVTGLWLHRVDHLVSLHPELPGPLRALRSSCDWIDQAYERVHAPVTHSRRVHEGIDFVWDTCPQGRQGTSSLFAVHVMLELRYARVILAGVPMTGDPRFYDACRERKAIAGLPGASTWPHDQAVDRQPWEEAAATWFFGRVRSVSGWTQKLLGEPEP